MFIGREKELALLQRAYEQESSAFIPIYGRRRVGKTELILRFIKPRTRLPRDQNTSWYDLEDLYGVRFEPA